MRRSALDFLTILDIRCHFDVINQLNGTMAIIALTSASQEMLGAHCSLWAHDHCIFASQLFVEEENGAQEEFERPATQNNGLTIATCTSKLLSQCIEKFGMLQWWPDDWVRGWRHKIQHRPRGEQIHEAILLSKWTKLDVQPHWEI